MQKKTSPAGAHGGTTNRNTTTETLLDIDITTVQAKSQTNQIRAGSEMGANGRPSNSDLPELPSLKAYANPSIQFGDWLDAYVEYASQRAPLAPSHWHLTNGVWLIAMASARRHYIPINWGSGKLYPNLYVATVAPTSVYSKSETIRVSRDTAQAAMPHLLLQGTATPEAAMNVLSGAMPTNIGSLASEIQDQYRKSAHWGARRGLILDEAGRFFNGLRRDYNIGLDALFCELYDASDHPIERETIKHGLIRVERPALSCLFATTPANIRSSLLAPENWGSGFWIRWIILTETELTPRAEPNYRYIPSELVKGLKRVADGDPDDEAQAVNVDKVVLDSAAELFYECRSAIQSGEVPETLHGWYARLHEKMLKTVLAMAIIEGQSVHLSHWETAISLAVRWRQDVHNVLTKTRATPKADLQDRIVKIAQDFEQRGKNGATVREIRQRLHRVATPEDIEDEVLKMEKLKLLRAVPRGRTTAYQYCGE
jgi:hypothetical protein